MKHILLMLAFMFSISFAEAQEGGKSKKHSNIAKSKITYSEHKSKKKYAKGRKQAPKKYMFAGEGVRRGRR